MRGLLTLCFVLSVFLLAVHAQDDGKEQDTEPPEIADEQVYDASSSASEDFVEEPPTEEEQPPEDDLAEPQEDPQDVFVDEQVTKEQMEALHGKMDGDSDGRMSLAEVLHFAQQVTHGIAKKNTIEIWTVVDENQDDKVSLQELLDHKFGAEIPEEDAKVEKTKQDLEDDAAIAKEKQLEKDTFKVADTNKDGFLDKEEIVPVFHPEVSPPILQVTSAFAFGRKDKDGDGQLSEDELFEKEEGDTHYDEDVKKENHLEFEKLDTDKSGKLSPEEYKKWESGEFHMHDDMNNLFEIADENNDKHITKGELHAAHDMLANTMASNRMADWIAHHEL